MMRGKTAESVISALVILLIALVLILARGNAPGDRHGDGSEPGPAEAVASPGTGEIRSHLR
jgi:hypothetical protein